MSLAIDTKRVVSVLLADGWHRVAKQSFDIDAYEYTEGPKLLISGGTVAGVPSTAASWTEPGGLVVAAPLGAVLAVKVKRP